MDINLPADIQSAARLTCKGGMRAVYESDPRIGLLIGTHGTPAFVRMQLESRARFAPEIPCIVHDDKSKNLSELSAICAQYDAGFRFPNNHLGHSVGDLHAFYVGLLWAHRHGIDLLVKVSRRFIPTHEWTAELSLLAVTTGASTFSHPNPKYQRDISTHLIALHVPSWITVADRMLSAISVETPLDVENMMLGLSFCFSDTFQHWTMPDRDQFEGAKSAMWRDHHSAFDYCNQARRWGIHLPTWEFRV